MTPPQLVVGSPQEILERLKLIDPDARVTLVIPGQIEDEETSSTSGSRMTRLQRAKALDQIADMNRDLPALPDEAYRRENLYDERM